MPAPIARVFKNRTAAKAAETDLQTRGFAADAIHVVTKPARKPAAAGTPSDPVLASILKTGVPPAHAATYAECVYEGKALVVVHPPFGHAASAVSALQHHNPIEVAMPETESTPTPQKTGIDWTSATPLSSWLGWKVLLDSPTPLSDWMNKPTLKPEPASSPTLESIRKQSADPTPLSSKFGWPLLSNEASPLSKKFGWNLLSGSPTPLSDKFGWKLTSDDPHPLSSKFGWPLLSKK
jgi:hypothetical protein